MCSVSQSHPKRILCRSGNAWAQCSIGIVLNDHCCVLRCFKTEAEQVESKPRWFYGSPRGVGYWEYDIRTSEQLEVRRDFTAGTDLKIRKRSKRLMMIFWSCL